MSIDIHTLSEDSKKILGGAGKTACAALRIALSVLGDISGVLSMALQLLGHIPSLPFKGLTKLTQMGAKLATLEKDVEAAKDGAAKALGVLEPLVGDQAAPAAPADPAQNS